MCPTCDGCKCDTKPLVAFALPTWPATASWLVDITARGSAPGGDHRRIDGGCPVGTPIPIIRTGIAGSAAVAVIRARRHLRHTPISASHGDFYAKSMLSLAFACNKTVDNRSPKRDETRYNA